MVKVKVCPICERVITSNHWVHKGCTKLSNFKFNKWKYIKLINCKPSELKLLFAPSSSDYNGEGRSSSLAIQEENEDNFTDDSQQINLPSPVMVPPAINKLKMEMDDIQKEEDNKDLITLLVEQKDKIAKLEKEIEELKQKLMNTKPVITLLVEQNDKIAKSEKEIEELKQKLMNTKRVTDIVDTAKSSSQLPIDTSELHERTERSIILNIEESKSADSNERKDIKYKLVSNNTVCPICDRVITSNQGAIECSGCLTWIHRRCTKLSVVEFDKIFALCKKNNSHQWKCINCKPSELKRLSAPSSSDYNAGGRSSSLAIHKEYEDYFTDDSTDNILSVDDSQQINERKDDKMHVTAVQYKLGGGGGGQKRTGYTKTLKLSNELAALVGQEQMAKHEVVKKVWSIIKEKDLYDPKNKHYAICDDDAMLKVIGVKRFRTFGMMKYLKNHFIS